MLDAILRPKSIAVIGASRRPGTIGRETVASLIRCGFAGALYPESLPQRLGVSWGCCANTMC